MTNPTGLRVEFYEDVGHNWRWTQYAANGEIEAACHEGLATQREAMLNWRRTSLHAIEILEEEQLYVRNGDASRQKIEAHKALDLRPYRVDPDRVEPFNDHTGVLVRAMANGQYVNADIAQLDRDSLRAWLSSKGDGRALAMIVVEMLLGHQDQEDETT